MSDKDINTGKIRECNADLKRARSHLVSAVISLQGATPEGAGLPKTTGAIKETIGDISVAIELLDQTFL